MYSFYSCHTYLIFWKFYSYRRGLLFNSSPGPSLILLWWIFLFLLWCPRLHVCPSFLRMMCTISWSHILYVDYLLWLWHAFPRTSYSWMQDIHDKFHSRMLSCAVHFLCVSPTFLFWHKLRGIRCIWNVALHELHLCASPSCVVGGKVYDRFHIWSLKMSLHVRCPYALTWFPFEKMLCHTLDISLYPHQSVLLSHAGLSLASWRTSPHKCHIYYPTNMVRQLLCCHLCICCQCWLASSCLS